MRTRLGKDPIQDWEKMKKYLKRQFYNMLGILYRSWMQLSNISMRRYHQHNIEERVLSYSVTIIQGCPTRCEIVELQTNAFVKVCRMRKCESTYANPILFIPKIYKNWMLFMILKSMIKALPVQRR